MTSALPPSPLPEAEQPAAISRHLVQVYTAYTGRGPESVRAHVSSDVVTVVLRKTLTKTERSLTAEDRIEPVETVRRGLQATMKDAFLQGIEAITGRHVEAFLSDHDVETDIAVEVFVFAPKGA